MQATLNKKQEEVEQANLVIEKLQNEQYVKFAYDSIVQLKMEMLETELSMRRETESEARREIKILSAKLSETTSGEVNQKEQEENLSDDFSSLNINKSVEELQVDLSTYYTQLHKAQGNPTVYSL